MLQEERVPEDEKPSFHESAMVALAIGAMVFIFIKILFL
jgi:hypothetical protein